MRMRIIVFISIVVLSNASCQSKTIKISPEEIIGGACEGCEAIHDYGTRTLSSIDTLPAYISSSPKIKVSGTVYQLDGETPAAGVILYVYHTNREGLYQAKEEQSTDWAKYHGDLRGWMKTNRDGLYTFYTFRPGAYPNGQEPEHIHITIKESTKNEYYLDSFVFDDDPLLTSIEREKLENRGGSGIIVPILENGLIVLKRDIILGLNIPNYN